MQEHNEDLQVFVEVLQTLTPEPEDLLRLRASESALGEKVARLEARLNGHHLQQTITKLQQAEVGLSPVGTRAHFYMCTVAARAAACCTQHSGIDRHICPACIQHLFRAFGTASPLHGGQQTRPAFSTAQQCTLHVGVAATACIQVVKVQRGRRHTTQLADMSLQRTCDCSIALTSLQCVVLQQEAVQTAEKLAGEQSLLQVEVQGLRAELSNLKQQLADLQASCSVPPLQHFCTFD